MPLEDNELPILHGEETKTVRVSKTQIKKECTEVNKFAHKLSKLSARHLERLDLPEEIKDELIKIISVRSHPVRNRLLKGVGALIRSSGQQAEIMKLNLH